MSQENGSTGTQPNDPAPPPANAAPPGPPPSIPAERVYALGHNQRPDPRWFLGVDFGQRHDHSAICVLDLVWIPRGRCPVTFGSLFLPQLTIRHLDRKPLLTSYEEIHEDLVSYLDQLQHRFAINGFRADPMTEIILDAGGPGPPMIDRIRRAIPGGVRISPVLITGGKGETTLVDGYTGVPRRSLITRFIQMVNVRHLTLPPALDFWEELKAELLDLKGDTMQPASSDGHDDLVMATSLAVWAACRSVPELVPGAIRRDNPGPPYQIGHCPFPLF